MRLSCFGLLAAHLFLFSACASSQAWIVEDGDDVGVLGYQRGNGRDAERELQAKFDATARAICEGRPYRVQRDRPRSETYLVSTYDRVLLPPTLNASPVYVPIARTSTVRWREAFVECQTCGAGLGVVYVSPTDFQIAEFQDGSKAPEAGLKIGDKVINIGGKAVGAATHLKVGDKALVTFSREGKIQSLMVEPVKVCNFNLAPEAPPAPRPGQSSVNPG